MQDSLAVVFDVLLVFLLVLLNGFFVAVEFAIVRSHPTKLRSPELYRKLGTRASLRLIEELDNSLSATQLGITVASLILGWWGETTFQKLLVPFFDWLSPQAATFASHAAATTLALVVISFLHVVIGELAAKSLAIRYPETTLRLLARPMVLFCVFFKPFIYFLNGSANLLLRMFGVVVPADAERVHSVGELAMLVSQSSESGVLDKHEEEMLKGVFGFSETVAREVMTPRTDVVTIPIQTSFDEIVSVVLESGLSRFPVVGEQVDDVKGFILTRDLLPFALHKDPAKIREFSVQRIMREPYFIPGTKPIDDLLNEFKRRKLHLAIVLDEHGGLDGVVTLEDLLEEIVGDIYDESDVAENTIVVEADGDIVVDGGVLVADINNRFNLQIPEGDYDTIAGFIFTCLGRLPIQGDRILINIAGAFHVNPGAELPVEGAVAIDHVGHEDVDGFRASIEEEFGTASTLLTVEKIVTHRIEQVRLHPFQHETQAESKDESVASEEKETESEKDISNG